MNIEMTKILDSAQEKNKIRRDFVKKLMEKGVEIQIVEIKNH